ncbi:LysR family transcriptional regulator [Pseudomonas sp. NPDC089569]|uniref:LysR family transcriptional regulator n=1 Tax=Pseudomonas sp. NPDC089569 TaxID=3390722 RepID=UPI003D06D119
MHSELRNLDLNLLLVFDAIYRHQSVVLAADELSLSPSACSHALTRLRQALSDDLFVRYGSSMHPSLLAEQIADDVSAALSILGTRLSARRHFKPAESNETFILAATDFTAFAILPLLMRQLSKQAPHIKVQVVYSAHRDALDDLAAGRVHFSLGFTNHAEEHFEGVEAINCFADDYVVLASASHPRLCDTLSIEQYLAERHVVVLPWSDSDSVIDNALRQQGMQRNVCVQLPSMMAAPFIVGHSEYLATLPRRAAHHFMDTASLRVLEAPFPSPTYYLKAFFHPRYAAGASHRWLREQIEWTFAKQAAKP